MMYRFPSKAPNSLVNSTDNTQHLLNITTLMSNKGKICTCIQSYILFFIQIYILNCSPPPNMLLPVIFIPSSVEFLPPLEKSLSPLSHSQASFRHGSMSAICVSTLATPISPGPSCRISHPNNCVSLLTGLPASIFALRQTVLHKTDYNSLSCVVS